MSQNFSGQNLQGKSFQGQDLIGANFSGADIRGVNFTGANLTNADFSNSLAGLEKKPLILLLIMSVLVSIVAGALSGIGGHFIEKLINDTENAKFGIFILVLLTGTFFFVCFWKGLGAAIKILVYRVVIFSLFMGAFSIVTHRGNGLESLAIIFTLLLLTITTVTGTIARAVGAGKGNLVFVIVALSGVLAERKFSGGLFGSVIAICSAIISKKAVAGNKQDAGIVDLALLTSSFFGPTSFREANLTNANFTNARLISADFRDAKLENTCWEGVGKLHLSLFNHFQLP